MPHNRLKVVTARNTVHVCSLLNVNLSENILMTYNNIRGSHTLPFCAFCDIQTALNYSLFLRLKMYLTLAIHYEYLSNPKTFGSCSLYILELTFSRKYNIFLTFTAALPCCFIVKTMSSVWGLITETQCASLNNMNHIYSNKSYIITILLFLVIVPLV